MAALTKRAPREPSAEARRLERKELRHESRRQAILDAARTLLVERGIEHFTIAAVASVAGVSKSAVYYYFESKEELVGGLAVAALKKEVELLRAAIARAPTGVEALVALLHTYVDHYTSDLDAFRVVYVWPQVIGIEKRLLESEIYPLSWSVNEALEAKLNADRAAGKLDPAANPRKLANVAWTTAHGLVSLVSGVQSVGGETRFPIDELKDEACRVLMRSAER